MHFHFRSKPYYLFSIHLAVRCAYQRFLDDDDRDSFCHILCTLSRKKWMLPCLIIHFHEIAPTARFSVISWIRFLLQFNSHRRD
jgi:hypothetical protein